jgi:hypothetical protein
MPLVEATVKRPTKTNPKARFRPELLPRRAAAPSVFQPAKLIRGFVQRTEGNRNVASVKMELFFSVHELFTETAEAVISNEPRHF